MLNNLSASTSMTSYIFGITTSLLLFVTSARSASLYHPDLLNSNNFETLRIPTTRAYQEMPGRLGSTISYDIPLLVKRPFERKDGSTVLGRMPEFIARDSFLRDESIKPTSRLARKNCFMSPLQCSFYYKRSNSFF
ncbi:hypothetical protein Ddc_03341 [Ditylenchus destructor]|nr:hypothetical protein Ddc_03341 [Ditylenchus destructor]